MPKTPASKHTCNYLISEETWLIIDARFLLHRYLDIYQCLIRNLDHRGRYLLSDKRQRRVAEAVKEVDSLLTSDSPSDKVGMASDAGVV